LSKKEGSTSEGELFELVNKVMMIHTQNCPRKKFYSIKTLSDAGGLKLNEKGIAETISETNQRKILDHTIESYELRDVILNLLKKTQNS